VNEIFMNPFQVHVPNKISVPILASIPHAGEFIPQEIAELMYEKHLQFPFHTDWYVDKLFNFLPEFGIPVITTTFSRYVVDLNRRVNKHIFGTFQDAPVFAQTSEGDPLYHTFPSDEDITNRIPKYYTPYHSKLTELLESVRRQFGRAHLLDLHSFRSHYLQEDVCLGNLNGSTCTPDFFDLVSTAFSAKGLAVAKNDKFIGGHITRHYAQMENVETLQIEIRRSFYLDQGQLHRMQRPPSGSALFTTAQSTLKSIFKEIICFSDRIFST